MTSWIPSTEKVVSPVLAFRIAELVPLAPNLTEVVPQMTRD